MSFYGQLWEIFYKGSHNFLKVVNNETKGRLKYMPNVPGLSRTVAIEHYFSFFRVKNVFPFPLSIGKKFCQCVSEAEILLIIEFFLSLSLNDCEPCNAIGKRSFRHYFFVLFFCTVQYMV